MCHKIIVSGENILIVNVYMPCFKQNETFIWEYSKILSELSKSVSQGNWSYIIFGGDFNTDLSKMLSI